MSLAKQVVHRLLAGPKGRGLAKFVSLGLLLGTAACDGRVIVFKPAVEVDPLPQEAEAMASPQEDARAKEQWNLDKIGLNLEARRKLAGSKTVTIAILSTGIDYNHEDLRGRVAVNQAEMKPSEPGSSIFMNNLDDDRNGELRGQELRFLRAWRDANANGVSDPGEVRPLGAYGIVAIRTRAEGRAGRVWFRRAGIVRRDGSTLPTYDWVAQRR